MVYCYICEDCIKKAADCQDLAELSVEGYNYLCSVLHFTHKHTPSDQMDLQCPTCGGVNVKKLLTPPITYTKGYGYLDKTGATNDRDLYLMTDGKDPYESSRTPSDKKEIIRKLRRNKEFNPKSKSTHMSSSK